MNVFQYLRDELFLVACSLYALNRWIIAPHTHSSFLHGYFNDLLLIPAALPMLLWTQRLCALRNHSRPPSAQEIFMHFVIWSIICEGIGPLWITTSVADPMDVLAYAGGGIVSWLWWQRSIPINASKG